MRTAAPSEQRCFPRESTLTCQSNDVQRGATHVRGYVCFNNIQVAFVKFGDPDISQLGCLLVKDGSEGLELCGTEGWIL